MTGLDCLREEMEKRGANKAQIESKTATMVLDILSEANGRYEDLAKLEADIKDCEDYLQKMKSQIYDYEQRVAYLYHKIQSSQEEIQKEIDKKYGEAIAYIEEFHKCLKECETPEGRDAMRRAQVFVNSVNIENERNNTYFIQGLAMVMANNPIGNITKYEKVPQVERNDSDVIGKVL